VGVTFSAGSIPSINAMHNHDPIINHTHFHTLFLSPNHSPTNTNIGTSIHRNTNIHVHKPFTPLTSHSHTHSHTHTFSFTNRIHKQWLCPFVLVCLCVCLSVCLPVCLSVSLSLCLSVCVCVRDAQILNQHLEGEKGKADERHTAKLCNILQHTATHCNTQRKT